MLSLTGPKEQGIVHIPILIAAIALIGFILVSSSADFKNKLFATLFPKPKSQAAENLPGSVRFVDSSGNTITTTTSATVKLKYTLPNVGIGSTNPSPSPSWSTTPSPTPTPIPNPVSAPISSPTPTPTPTPVTITNIALAEDNPLRTNLKILKVDSSNTANYIFSDSTPGTKNLYVKFIDSNGYPINATPFPVTIQLVAPTPSPVPSTSYQRIFVTSTRYNGNLGGLSGADVKCQDRANAANLGGTWKAWLSDSTTSASSRLVHSSNPYKLLDGRVVANNWADLTGGTIQNPIEITELGTKLKPPASCSWCAFGFPWTNTYTTGNIIYNTKDYKTCNDFTSSADTGDTTSWRQGNAFDTTFWSRYQVSQSCIAASELYCFEQTSAATPTPTPSPTATPSPTPYPTPTPTPVAKYPPCDSIGDVNGDGRVSDVDANRVLQAVVGKIKLTTEQTRRANVDGIKGVTSADARLISRYVAGLESTFPVCKQPTVTTNQATRITRVSAVTNGSVNPNGLTATTWFRYARFNPSFCNDSFGTKVPITGINLGSGNSVINTSISFGGLSTKTRYYFCAIARNSAGTALGNIQQFTTLP